MAKKKETDGLVEVAAAAVKAELKISREDLARSIIDSLGYGRLSFFGFRYHFEFRERRGRGGRRMNARDAKIYAKATLN